MTYPCQSACTPWADITDVDLCAPCNNYDFDLTILDEALSVATDLLFELSGRRFPGSCSETIRPCPSFVSCGCDDWRSCGCNIPRITLGEVPVTDVTEVILDGVTLTDGVDYRVDDWRYLVRLRDADGRSPGWPQWQELDLPVTEDNTFQITFTYGLPPPPAGVRAAAVLACQLALACHPEGASVCQLPTRVQQITRQGVSMVLLDPFEFLDKGRTGISQVDSFLSTYNPHGLKRRASVLNVDRVNRIHRVNT